jgi:hypothetical protein
MLCPGVLGDGLPELLYSTCYVQASLVMDCRSWQPVPYLSQTDRPEETAGLTLAAVEGANDRLEAWKKVLYSVTLKSIENQVAVTENVDNYAISH